MIELVKKFKKEIREGEIRRVQQRKQKLLNLKAEMSKRSELLEKYTAKILFEQNNKKFENEYLKKLDKIKKVASSSEGETLKEILSWYTFFLNQQFITQSTRADCGSYFVTTYIKTHTI